MTKTLEMVFRSTAGKDVTLSLADPKADLTLSQVQTVMQDIASRNIFSISGAELKDVVTARIRSRDAVDLV
ncbi:MAG TPA: DUF2922 domain-containing protein [Patescibacteria group bacterium]|nr:DUF2922 domain-containing protein [Patescibacteria group bacterium]